MTDLIDVPAMPEGPAIIIRDLGPKDHAFLFNSWLQSYAASEFAKPIPKKIYFQCHHAAIERILTRGAQVDVAVLADDPEVLIGWVCYEGGLIHYAYVKETFRRGRVASRLIERVKLPTAFSHLTQHPSVNHIRRNLGGSVLYNPYCL